MSTALERAYRTEGPRLLNWIRSRIGNLEDAEDLLQDVFSRATRSLGTAGTVDNLVAWLYASARNAVVDAWRRRGRRGEDADLENVTPESLVAEFSEGPEAKLRRSVVAEAIEDALDDLPDDQREVFWLQAVEGCTFRELSELLDIPINTAMSRKRYAVKRLRDQLSDLRDFLDSPEG